LSATRKMVITSCLVLVICGAVAWTGIDRLAGRFAEIDDRTVSYRRGAWADAWRVATLFPYTGTGLNTYGTSMLLFQEHDLARHYREAHSDYLQLAAEGGLLLALPVLLCGVVFVREVRRSSRGDTERGFYWIRAGAIVGVTAIAVQETVEFSLQMPGNAVLFAVVCGIALARPLDRRGSRRMPGPP
jgi:O-antigen ligase